MAFQTLNLEPKDELKQEPSSQYIRSIAAVGVHVWCGYASGEIQIWDGADGQPIHTLNAHPGVGVACLFYSERTNLVWSGGNDGKVCVWNAPEKQCVRWMHKHTSAVKIINQVGNFVWTIADSEGGAFLWEQDTIGNGSHSHANGFPNGKLSKSNPPRTPSRSPPHAGGVEETVPLGVVYLGAGIVSLLSANSMDTNTLLWAGAADGTIRVIDAETKEVARVLTGHTAQVNTLLLVGSHVWSASNDKSIRIWHARVSHS